MQKDKIEFNSTEAEEMWEDLLEMYKESEAKTCLKYVEAAILKMQQVMEEEGKSVAEVADEAMRQTIPEGITGIAAIQTPYLIHKLWKFGEEYWLWFKEAKTEYLSKIT